MLGLCVVAVVAVCAYAVSSASALPEWGRCVAKTGGKYEDRNCTVKAKGKTGKHEFEWEKGANLPNVKFTGHNVGSGGVLSVRQLSCRISNKDLPTSEKTTRKGCTEKGEKEKAEDPEKTESEVAKLHEEVLSIKVECGAESSSGEEHGKDSIVNVSVTFTGCHAGGTIPCTSSGAASGEVKVNPLKGSLGYINKAEKKVGVLLEPVTKHGRFAEFECGAGIVGSVVGVGNKKEGAWYEPEKDGGYDGIISPITPVNTMSNAFEQVYSASLETDENAPRSFEGKHIDLLESYITSPKAGDGSMWSRAAEIITNVNTPEEEGEIKA